jgi:hypothetical protein
MPLRRRSVDPFAPNVADILLIALAMPFTIGRGTLSLIDEFDQIVRTDTKTGIVECGEIDVAADDVIFLFIKEHPSVLPEVEAGIALFENTAIPALALVSTYPYAVSLASVPCDFTIGVSLRVALNAVNSVQNDKNRGTLIEGSPPRAVLWSAAKKLSVSPSNSGSGRLAQSQKRALWTGAPPVPTPALQPTHCGAP